jgi:hypothetical protein
MDPTSFHCDFCYQTGPSWVLPAQTFDFIGGRSMDDWFACDTCAELIMHDDWDALLRRVEQEWSKRHSVPLNLVAVETLRITYSKLRENIRGPLRKL